MERYLKSQIKMDLKRKMSFVAGPRQVGKTKLAKSLMQKGDAYLNWDTLAGREAILKQELPARGLLIFDEIHKYKSWRNYLKGVFDERQDSNSILVTGSARLDLYRRGGDSLQGRYHFLRLFPLSAKELRIKSQAELRELFELGGFPEPFFSQSKTEARRWSKEYRSLLIREEVRSLEQTVDLGNMELLFMRLPSLVGSPLSINSLREDLQLAHATVAKWLKIFERLYGIFRLSPLGGPKIRAVKKEQKHYHFDWTLPSDPSFAFENMVALHLLKWTCFLEDTQGLEAELRYFRDIDNREVDFVVLESGKPQMAVECKWGDAEVSKALIYLKKKYPSMEAWQISMTGKKDYLSKDQIRVAPAISFFQKLI